MARNFVTASSQYGTATPPTGAKTMPLTMAFWFRPTNLANFYHMFNIDDSAGITDGYGLGYTQNIDVVAAFQFASGNYTDASSGAAPLTAGTWTHLAGVFTSATSRAIWVNGSSAGTDTTNSTPNSANLNQVGIGGYFSGGTLYSPTNGDMAQCGIWSAALLADELLALTRGYAPNLIRPASLVWYAPLMGRSSPEPEMRNSNAITLVNTPVNADNPRIISARGRISRPKTAAAPGGGFQAAWAMNTNLPVIGTGTY